MSRNIEKEYVKLSPEQAVLHRPASYIGSINTTKLDTWVPGSDGTMTHKSVEYNPGLWKIFDECITNALDASKRDKTVKNIKIQVDDDSFSVWNDGNVGIPIQIHKDHNLYVPELIFSHVHSGSNYDDDKKRVWAGTNGVGSKAAIIFSTASKIEVIHDKQKYKQTFENNLTQRSKPKITKTSSPNSVSIFVKPDFKRFRMDSFQSNMTVQMMYKRALEVGAMTSRSVTVHWNDTKIPVNTFEAYIDLFIGKDRKEVPRVVIYDKPWTVGICLSPIDGYSQVSSVNGCTTMEGGTHVEHIVTPLIKQIADKIQSKNKDVTIRPQYIRDNMMVFVDTEIGNPKFSSQTKEKLISVTREFGSRFELSDDFVRKVEKLGIADNILAIAKAKDIKNLKTGQRKKSRITDIPKLNDANRAGGPHSGKCTLILTEGDSAKSMALSGIQNRDYFGVFPLKGKLLNVRDVTAKKLSANVEIQSVIQILGLQFGKEYTTAENLRYGKVLIMTDQDEDGYHIKGLTINLIACYWPSLLKISGFISAMLTPIVKAKKGTEIEEFYNIPDYNKWKQTHTSSNWKVKYYKGLGTSTATEAKEYFRRMNSLNYQYMTDADPNAVTLAFGKDIKNGATDKRKDWIRSFIENPQDINYKKKIVPVSEFIDRELVLFSIADNLRSLPNIVDGLKESQRKVLFACFKRNLTKEIKVAQLSGYVSEHSAYHHGEESLNKTIISMAQKFIGHNNINLLAPNGQFGSRLSGGSDSASPRYIFTKLKPNKLFNPEDNVLLNYLNDDGMTIEPTYYVPTMPLLLINGSRGIGTGFSTFVPCFNPADIKANLLKIMNSKRNPSDIILKEMVPWYDGFTGTIVKTIKNKWSTHGVFSVTKNKVRVTELPIGTWTNDYIEFLKKLEEEGEIQRYDDYSNESKVDIQVTFGPACLKDLMRSKMLESKLKLQGSLAATNIHVLDEKGQIIRLDTPEDVIRMFYTVRERFYGLRKAHLEKRTTHELNVLQNKIRFIKDVSKGDIKLYGKKKAVLVEQLTTDKYYSWKKDTDKTGYQYLLDTKCEHFTKEKITLLESDIKKKEGFLEDIEGKTPIDLWKIDLN